jgi:hypothetical protein
VHYGVEEITVNVRKMLKKFYRTYLLIRRSLKVALHRSIILKYMYEIVMTATSNRTRDQETTLRPRDHPETTRSPRPTRALRQRGSSKRDPNT